MATVPLSGSNIRLLSGVPFSNDYKNTRWFDTQSLQTTYFNNRTVVHAISQANFQRIEGQHFISVNKSIDDLWGVNYLMFQNTSYNSKWFYAFVTKIEYVQKNTTYVHFQIDVLQTWKFEMNFKPSFVIREHCKLWNSDGTPVINTVDEGLNYGSEYDTTFVQNYQPNGGYKWLVIVTKNPIHTGVPQEITPTVIGVPQPLTVYLLPFKDDDTIPNIFLEKLNVGVMLSKPSEVLTNIYKGVSAVNNVVSLYITDYTGIPTIYSGGLITFPTNSNDIEPAQIPNGSDYFNCLYVKKVLDFDTLTQPFGDKYSGYNPVKESKLLMYPYCNTILDDFKGNRVVFKNEYINNSQLEVIVKGSLGTSNKTSYGIKDYNFNANGLKDELSDEYALINSEPNDVPIITDMLSAYLQGNRNSLAVQKASINFNGMTDAIGGGIGAIASGMTGNGVGVASGITGVVQGAGNTVLQLQGLEAKKQDIANTPPNITKQGSNTSYTIGNNYNGVYVIKKQIKSEYIKKLENFFKMFGYKVNEVKTPNFHTRQNWNYIQTSSCNITGNFNNSDLNELKSVFDNGITLWHTDNVCDYSLENEVI